MRISVLKNTITYATLLLTLLSGCSTPTLLDKNAPLTSASNGLVFCVFSHKIDDEATQAVNENTAAELIIRPVGTTQEIRILNTSADTWINGGWKKKTLTSREDNQLRLVSAASLPAGEYELISTNFQVPGMTKLARTYVHPLHFSVKPNEIVYIGQYHFQLQTKKTLLGGVVPYKIAFSIQDYFDPDLALLMQARPEAKDLTSTNGVKGFSKPGPAIGQ